MPALNPDTGTAERTSTKKKGGSRRSAANSGAGYTAHGSVAQIVEDVARQYGIPPAVALAIANQESGLNPQSVGDGGTSFGLFQLHEGGELGSHDSSWAFDPRNNAETALRVVASVRAQHPDWSWGQVAAGAQRPADQAGYAVAIDSALGRHATYTTSDVGVGGDVSSGALGTPQPLSRRGYVGQLDSQYGYLSAFTKIPAVKRILTQAARNGWSQDRMLAALEKTAWWKNTTATSRSWKALQATDPGEASRQLNQRIQQIQQEAKSTLGYHLDPDRAQHLANTSIAADWSQAQIQHAIGAEFKYAGAKQTYEGAAGQTVAQLQAIAKQYVVPLSQDTLEKYAKQILEGTYTTDDFTAYAQQQAESLYPTLKSALQSGQTVVQWADPYVQLASQILERPADQFNLANPRWSKALLQPQPDGERKAMDLADWADYLRSQPEYKDTNQAKAATADFGLALVNAFGKVSTPSTGNLGPTAINFGAT